MSHDAFDKIEVRCPQLGGEVTFGYCRRLNQGMPCGRALLCYQLKFPVDQYFNLVLEEETFRKIFLDNSESRMDKILRTFSEARERVADL